MTQKDTAAIDNVIDKLKSSPMFQLSLSSKELFHSNFLAWLCENYPVFGGKIFASCLSETSCNKIIHVDRERKNIDLWVRYSNGEELIIENKVKSQPGLAQLDKYYAMISKTVKSARFLLLSLTRPAFLAEGQNSIGPNGMAWNFLSYGELGDRIKKLLDEGNCGLIDGYHKEIIEDYADFISNIHQLQQHFVIDWDSSECFFTLNSHLKKLESIRFHDVMAKIRYSQLAGKINQTLSQHGFSVTEDITKFWTTQDGIMTDSGMTRATGLFDLKYCLMSGQKSCDSLSLGIQLQGNDFRLVVERPKGGDALDIAKALHSGGSCKRWFDFGMLEALHCLPGEYPKIMDDFNKFGDGFKYRSRHLGENVSPKDLVDTIIKYTMWIKNNADNLRGYISTLPVIA